MSREEQGDYLVSCWEYEWRRLFICWVTSFLRIVIFLFSSFIFCWDSCKHVKMNLRTVILSHFRDCLTLHSAAYLCSFWGKIKVINFLFYFFSDLVSKNRQEKGCFENFQSKEGLRKDRFERFLMFLLFHERLQCGRNSALSELGLDMGTRSVAGLRYLGPTTQLPLLCLNRRKEFVWRRWRSYLSQLCWWSMEGTFLVAEDEISASRWGGCYVVN